MTKLEMKFDFQRKMRAFRRGKKREIDEEISKILSKWVIKVAGGFFVLGMVAGRVSR